MNLEQVVQRAKVDIAKRYVYVMMPIPQIETLLAGLEDLQSEVDRLREDRNYHQLRSTLLTGQNKYIRESVVSDGVFTALRYYQKQGLCEGTEFEEIERFLDRLGPLSEVKEESA